MTGRSPPIEYVNSFGFVRSEEAPGHCEDLSDSQLEAFCRDYASTAWPQFTLTRKSSNAVRIFPDSWAGLVPLTLIRQLGLYADTILLHDPILEAVVHYRELEYNPQFLFTYPTKEARTRAYAVREIAPAIAQVLRLQPLIEAGVVELVPTHLLALPKQPGTFTASDFYGPSGSALDLAGKEHEVQRYSEQLVRTAEEELKVVAASFAPDGGRLIVRPLTEPTNSIALRFNDDDRHRGYNLMTVSAAEGDDRTIVGHFDPNATDIDPDMFRHWLSGSKKNFIADRLFALERDILLAGLVGASFITALPTTRRLASVSLDSDVTEPMTAVSVAASVDLPYLSDIDFDDLLSARRNEVAFEDFRVALDRLAREFRAMDPAERPARVQELVRETITAPALRVQSKMAGLRRSFALDAIVLAGNLSLTLLSGGTTLTSLAALAATGIIAKHYASQKQAEDEVRQSAGFFFWDLTKRVR